MGNISKIKIGNVTHDIKDKNLEERVAVIDEVTSRVLTKHEDDIAAKLDKYFVFSNPVGPWCPDPCFWKADDGYFYIKGTGRLATVKKTRNFVSYEDTGRTFISDTAMTWLAETYGHYATDEPEYILYPNCWAPFVIKIGDNWILYQAIVERTGTKAEPVNGDAHIVAFTSKTPYGDFSNPITIVSDGDYYLTNSVVWNNVIDPFVYCNPEDQKIYLVAGSSYSIGRLELTSDGLSTVLAKGVRNKCVRMAGLTINSDETREQVYESSYIYTRVHQGVVYHYLFASKGAWDTRNYGVIVGRSTTLNSTPGSIIGYKDKNGKDLITKLTDESEIANRTILSTESDSSTFWGPGHIGGIFETADGKTWMLYHCHDGNGTQDRKLFIQEVLWDENGWPYFGNNGHPVTSGEIGINIITESTNIENNDIILIGANKMVVLTQAQYDSLSTKDANTLYFIK